MKLFHKFEICYKLFQTDCITTDYKVKKEKEIESWKKMRQQLVNEHIRLQAPEENELCHKCEESMISHACQACQMMFCQPCLIQQHSSNILHKIKSGM